MVVLVKLESSVRVARELRALRLRRGVSGAAVAAELGWSQAKVSRIESGRLGVGMSDLTELLEVLGASPALRVALLALAARAAGKSAWMVGDASLRSRQSEVGAIEREAMRVREHHPVLVPGLLQSVGYVASLAVGVGYPDVDRYLADRLARQAVLDEPGPPRYEAVVDARSLRRVAGGVGVLREQLEYLLLRSHLPSVTLRIIPESLNARVLVIGAFVMYEFRDPEIPEVVLVETPLTDVYYASDETWQTYSLMWDRLVEDSLSVDQSREWLRQQLEEIGD